METDIKLAFDILFLIIVIVLSTTLVLGRELLSIARYLAWRLANGRCNNESRLSKPL
jgi:hypothetical protein